MLSVTILYSHLSYCMKGYGKIWQNKKNNIIILDTNTIVQNY